MKLSNSNQQGQGCPWINYKNWSNKILFIYKKQKLFGTLFHHHCILNLICRPHKIYSNLFKICKKKPSAYIHTPFRQNNRSNFFSTEVFVLERKVFFSPTKKRLSSFYNFFLKWFFIADFHFHWCVYSLSFKITQIT